MANQLTLRHLLRSLLPILTPLVLFACYPHAAVDRAERDFLTQTGLQVVGTEPDGASFEKTHRGYPVRFEGKIGEVWGRYVARVAAGEIGRETGGLFGILTGQYSSSSQIVGSRFDRLLSQMIGQPISVMVSLRHNKPLAPRANILSDYSNIVPDERFTDRGRLSTLGERLETDDVALAQRILKNTKLIEGLGGLRSVYIRIDEYTVTLFFAGTETEYSSMIRHYGSYPDLVNGMMDVLADIAELL